LGLPPGTVKTQSKTLDEQVQEELVRILNS